MSPIYPSSSYHCLAFWLALGAPLIAAAHSGQVRIELNVTQASPGATINLHSSGFGPGDTTTIMLVNAERQQLLGAATADDHGDLARAVLLPIDLTTGAYEARVADTHHVTAAPLNIVPDSSRDEEGDQRGEDEPLLAPMPLTHRAIAPLSTQTTAAPTSTANARDSSAGTHRLHDDRCNSLPGRDTMVKRVRGQSKLRLPWPLVEGQVRCQCSMTVTWIYLSACKPTLLTNL